MRTPTETIDREECLRLLASQHVGRIAFVTADGADVQPVNFVMDGDAVVFATTSGRKLWSFGRGAVSFEVDESDADERSGWSVVLHGTASEVLGPDLTALTERIGDVTAAPWPKGARANVVRIAPTTVTGRRITHAPEPAAEPTAVRPELWIG